MRSIRGRGRARLTLLGAPAVAVALLTGCGEDEADAPGACLAPASAYLEALRDAPEPVVLDGSTPISDCLTPDQDPAELGQIGEEMVNAATHLNAEALREPSGEATVKLGYLVGAAQEGAAESGDIHADLLRRLDAAARFSEGGEPLSASFERAFGEGYAAGQETG